MNAPNNNRFRLNDFTLAANGSAIGISPLPSAIAVSSAPAALSLAHAAFKSAMGLDCEVLQEQGIHWALRPTCNSVTSPSALVTIAMPRKLSIL